MARAYRFQGEGYIYHITSRGDDRKKIFTSANDYQKFLNYLVSAKIKYKFYLYAYCLMDNHYHLLIEISQPNLSKIMQYMNTAYTVYYNTKHKRCGHLFQGRYKSIIVDADSYLLELTRYIHLNPVRAKITDKPEKYKWTSYMEYIGEYGNGIIDKRRIENNFAVKSNDYKEFVYEGIGKEKNLRNNIHAGFILGREEFAEEISKEIKNIKTDKEYAYKKIIHSINPEEIVDRVTSYYETSPQNICNAREKHMLSKKTAVYLLKKYTTLTNREIGSKFGITYSGVTWIDKNVKSLIEKDGDLKKGVDAVTSQLKV
jgi:REP element-mobilizing transposase RayT